MRYLPLFLALFVLVSCGKESTNSASSRQESNNCVANGDYKCDPVESSDGLGVDLLDTVVDVPAEISDSEITFLASKVSRDEGRRASCETEVRNGEVYRYSLSGDRLNLQTPKGSYTMTRLNDDGAGLTGAWNWKGYTREGMHVIKTMTIVGQNRVILKTHCEL